ncbi:YibE/F family protein [Actinokineospora sp. PR83]|uniref:YibE/F family protein n=1 Tax=Actinokineospora sp. PR83 TaxID=2884908 RepID=UPI0035AC02E3
MYGVDDGDTQPIPRVRAERPRRDPATPHRRQTPERRETPGRRPGPTRREERERREEHESHREREPQERAWDVEREPREGAERGRRPKPAARPAPGEKPAEPPVVTGHGHGHGHGPARPVSDRVRRLLVLLLAPFALASVVGMVVLFPTGDSPTAVNSALQQAVHGEVTGAQAGPCGATDSGGDQCLVLTVAMSDGAAAGSDVRTALPLEPSTPRFSVGDEVVLSYSGGDPLAGESYQVVDFQRGVPLAVLAALFALAVLVLGRWQGFKALGALVLSFAVLLLFVLPAILAGESPLLVAVFGAGVIMFAVLYLTHGLSARTSTAVLGTMVSLALIGVLSALFAAVSSLTGLDEDTSALVGSLGHGIDTRGLLLAGIVIGALGVLDDVTVTQTSAVWELRAANPALGWRALYAAGLRIGRDHVSSAVNTLVMAYAGAALPVLLYSSISGVGLGTILQSQSIAQEVVRTLVGSIGLVAAVPVTTAVAALVAVREPAGEPA